MIENTIDQYITTTKFNYDENIFDRVLDLVISLDPEQLDDGQLEEVMDIIDDLETEDEITEARRSGRTSIEKRREAKKYWNKNKVKIKLKRKKFKKSSEGRKRKRIRKRMEKSGRTALGRKKVTYHV